MDHGGLLENFIQGFRLVPGNYEDSLRRRICAAACHIGEDNVMAQARVFP
jgi:hypothetical protein